MGTTKKYWKGIDELKETPAYLEGRDQEFPQSMSVDEFLGDESLNEASTGRRDFLKFLGFSVAAATLASCEAPVTKAIPYVIKPENVTPGMPTWYASTYYDGASYASILVKTREGRPIFVKGNPDFGFTKGNVNPQIVASVLSLYDSTKLKGPKFKGAEKANWSADIDAPIKSELASIKAKGGKIVFVTNTIISPALKAAIEKFKATYGTEGNFEHIQYDAVSYAGIRKANELSFGKNVIPDYDFSKAKTIVSVGADFLGSWLMSVEYQAQYGETRNPDAAWMSKHFQFESNMSVTGTASDYRAMIKPSEQAKVLSYILGKFGVRTSVPSDLQKDVAAIADRAVEELKKTRGESVVVAGANDVTVQVLANKLNSVIGAYSTTININNPVNLFASEDEKMYNFAKDLIAGKKTDAIFFYGANPVYTLPNGKEFSKALEGISLSVSFSAYEDETASKCKYITPDLHALEAWNDYAPKANHYSIAQPTIRPLFNAASVVESLLVWSDESVIRGGKDSKVAYRFIRDTYESNAANTVRFDLLVHNSCIDTEKQIASAEFNDAALSNLKYTQPAKGGFEIELYQKAAIGTGLQVGNPWLQEMPDPITKVTWDNYITMNPVQMKKLGYATTYDERHGLNLATVNVNGVELELPVVPSPGQTLDTVGIALGYGRGENGESVGAAAYVTKEYGGFELDENGNKLPVGKNAFKYTSYNNGTFNYYTASDVKKSDKPLYAIAATQIHHTVMGRHSIIKETTLDIYKSTGKEAYNPSNMLVTHHGEVPVSEFDLWEAHPVEKIGHRWAMTIDLNQCYGCGSCLVACQAENNVPVVGKHEVRKGREMAWLRIDRYYSSEQEVATGLKKDRKNFDYDEAELASLNPKVVHMPMMCQHCNHAPCETVCPVAATNHSNEGLNQMAYNRCIGTRYCANNCPYKVRRFNWFNYPSYKKFTQVNPAQDDLGRMVLNPDVTVRTRGVMEKCSFCVQKIQAGKLVAKTEGRPVQDGDVTTACAEVCPSGAIIVGDWNDINSMVRKSSEEKRSYQVLEEIGVKPHVWYKTKVRNDENAELAKVQVDKPVAHHEAEGHETKKHH